LRDSSFFTEPIAASTAYDLPYKESMAKTGSGATEQTPFDRGLKTYKGAIGRQLTETTGTKEAGWNQAHTSDPDNANAISVNDYTTDAWLMMPAVYIRETGNLTPKSLSFSLTGFDDDRTKGAKPTYNDTKLKVLVSDNGLFTEANVVETLNADSLTADERVFSIDLTEWEGFVQVAFVFESPTGAQTPPENEDEETEERPEPWYLEIQNLILKYDVDICFPVESIRSSLGAYEVSVTWQAVSSAVEYGIFWKLYDDAEYSAENVAYTKDTRYTITGLKDQSRYKAKVVAYCNEDRTLAAEPVETSFRTLVGCHTPQDFHVEDITTTGANFISTTDQPDYISYRVVHITPDEGGKSFTLRQRDDLLHVQDSLTEATAYTATTQAVCDDEFSPMSEAIRFTTHGGKPNDPDDTTAVETPAQLSTLFSVRAQDGQVAIQNANGLLVRNVSIHNLNGAKLADYRVDSRDDLMLPVNAQRLMLFVRLQTERGTVVYKVYLP
ncbi:MAG: fibronectin type III domain-containing protein, partial [Bacteroidales bacterium]|nr:fibronectin type III domain-containing protein [Bacteroidales bacterium]